MGCDGKGKRIAIVTFGCQMNERDSETICSMMRQEGYTPVSSHDEADLIIFNTCSVRKHAEDRVWGKLNELSGLKRRENGDSPHSGTIPIFPIIGLVGCMGKAYGKGVFKQLPHVDFVCGPANIYDIPRLVERVKGGSRHIVAVDNATRPLKMETVPIGEESPFLIYRDEKIRAWVNISEGCDNFCSYCIVPYVRGRQVSRPAKDIIDEIKSLLDRGTKEITFLGQNVNSYKDGKIDFAKLLELANNINGLKRIRFMTSHPKDATAGLFRAMRSLDKVCEHLHLPLQSGSDRILRLMNRGYSSSHYMKLIDDFKKEMPDGAITTDIIVGFPTETEDDFKDTYMLMQKIAFDGAFIFKYSARPFTKAAEIKDDVPKDVKEERNQILLNLQDKITKTKNESLIGTAQESLGLAKAKRNPASSYDFSTPYIKGRTRTNRQVVYRGDKPLIGAVSNVKIRDVEEHTLIGEVI